MESESSDPLSLQQAKTSDAQPTPAATNGLDDSGQGSQTKTSDAQPPPPTASGEDEVVQSTDVNTEDARHPPPATSGLENSEHSSQHKPLHVQPTPATSGQRSEPILPASGVSSWAKNLKVPQSLGGAQEDSQAGNGAKSTFVRLASGLGLQFSPANQTQGDAVVTSNVSQAGVFDSFKKGLVDSSRSAVKAVQVKARHMVSQNKRRYQDGEFDLDMTYITHNIIAMGFPAGDMSSGLFGYVEGFYRNHMEEVIKFFESHHKGKYKVYNLCSERLYDASLFQGKAASFPFDDHNCPPVNLILSFCQSASTWLKEDIENVVVVHCKAGLGRTGLMISSLLLYLTFCPTAEESMDYFNQKRCVDGKGLILPSQIRYVKYFERILKDYGGQNPNGRRCMLRGFRLHGCPYWIRPSITISDHNGILFSTKKHPKTKDLMPEDFWIKTSKKGVVIFALPGEPGLTELSGDFKIHFHDRHGDFYCWLNTAMMENKTILSSDDLDGYDKRKLPSPRFQLDIVMVDYNGKVEKRPTSVSASNTSDKNSDPDSSANKNNPATTKQTVTPDAHNKDDVFSDSEGEEETKSSTSNQAKASNAAVKTKTEQTSVKEPARMKTETGPTSGLEIPKVGSSGVTDFKAIAADASVFSFGDEDDESD